MDPFLGGTLVLWCFAAPALAWWYLVFQRPEKDAWHSILAALAIGTFGTPLIMFVSNRLLGLPLTIESVVAMATALVVLAGFWHWWRLQVSSQFIRRILRLLGDLV